MTTILRLEGLGLFLLSSYLYGALGYDWYWFFLLFFTPDVSFIGYLISPKFGGVFYNILHHQGCIAIVLLIGLMLQHETISTIALIYFAHSNFDRMLGYGLKQLDSFNATHLGTIFGNKAKHID